MRKVVFTEVCFVAAASLNAQSLKQFACTWRVDPASSRSMVSQRKLRRKKGNERREVLSPAAQPTVAGRFGQDPAHGPD